MRLRLYLYIALLLLLVASLCFGTDHYVRDGASGDGSSWTAAWDDLPGSLTRGDTYYIADGTYDHYYFDDAPSGSLVITIKKATAADHGTETGWSSAYGDGEAVFVYDAGQPTWAVMEFTEDYYLFDGQTRSTWSTGYGFRVDPGTQANTVQLTGQPANITLRYIDMEGVGLDGESKDCLYGIESGASHCSDITVQYCYLHHSGRNCALVYFWEDTLFEYCKFALNSSNGVHAQGIQMSGGTNVIFRYNLWEDIEGTGYIVVVGTAAHVTGLEVYGNVFYYTYANPESRTGVGTGSICILDYNEGHDTKIYNNTFINIPGYNSRISVPNESSSNNLVYNNLWYDCVPAQHVGVTADYNWYYDTTYTSETHEQAGSGDPFVDWVNGDFHLSAATDAGTTLGSPYNVDPDGVTRGEDATWDRGAYEYAANGNGGGEKSVMVLLSQIQVMPIFWALFSVWAYVVVSIVHKL